jgi:hypothetical protein
MTIEWEQVLDEHNWMARVGNLYKLRVFPGFNRKDEVIVYHAQVSNVNLDEIAVELSMPTVEIAKRRAASLALKHCWRVADALMGGTDGTYS